MSEFDDLIDGFDGLETETPSSMGERPGDIGEVAGSTPAGSTGKTEIITAPYSLPDDEPPHEPDDWPEPEPEIPLYADIPVVVDPELPDGTVMLTELRALKPDQRPEPGKHYVVFGGIPRPVIRGNAPFTEDEFVREQLDGVDTMKDPDGQRVSRADRTLRQRYRGYVCGEMASL